MLALRAILRFASSLRRVNLCWFSRQVRGSLKQWCFGSMVKSFFTRPLVARIWHRRHLSISHGVVHGTPVWLVRPVLPDVRLWQFDFVLTLLPIPTIWTNGFNAGHGVSPLL